VTDWVERVLAGDTRAAARLCRLVDDQAPGYREQLRALHRVASPAYVVGVTGTPGAGKSTLVDRLVSAYRKEGRRVGVVAIDPTSPFTGGAILGDRIRMQRHFEDPDVFIRSLATRGALGGLSRSASDVVHVLEAWGASVVLLETVGVGQDELDVTRVADSTVVVLAPGQGDDVQSIKAGILECADVFVVNKADRPGADATARDLENMLALGALSLAAVQAAGGHSAGHSAARLTVAAGGGSGWTPPIVKTVATTDSGIDELAEKLAGHRAWTLTEEGHALRAERTRSLLEGWLREELGRMVADQLGPELAAAADDVLSRAVDPHGAVEALLARFRAR